MSGKQGVTPNTEYVNPIMFGVAKGGKLSPGSPSDYANPTMFGVAKSGKLSPGSPSDSGISSMNDDPLILTAEKKSKAARRVVRRRKGCECTRAELSEVREQRAREDEDALTE